MEMTRNTWSFDLAGSRFFLGLLHSLFVTLLFVANARAQSSTSNLALVCVQEWHSLRAELRETFEPFRNPKFEFELLHCHEASDGSAFEIKELPRRLVIVLGGLQGSQDAPRVFAAKIIARLPNKNELGLAAFHYPNDGSIAESAQVFSSCLEWLAQNAPHCEIAIVAHSMGSLVARYALEVISRRVGANNESFRVSNVDRLIMICPPNQGSVLAQYADALELSDFLKNVQQKGFSIDLLIESLIHDGMGEACDELRPGSALLTELSRTQRCPGVLYSIMSGTGGFLSPLPRAIAMQVGDRLRAQLDATDVEFKWIADKAQELLASEELAAGYGDGAVAVHSTKLAGVTDCEQLPIHHLQWTDPPSEQVDRLVAWVVARLK